MITTLLILAGCNHNSSQNTQSKVEETTVNESSNEEVYVTQIDLMNELLGEDTPNGEVDGNGIEMSLEFKNEEVLSHYRTTLTSEGQLVYDGIANAIRTMVSEYLISVPIDPDQIQHIMRVILLDEPEFFYLRPAYSYELDESGNVSKVLFVYNMTIEKRNEFEVNLLKNARSVYAELNRNNGQKLTEIQYVEQILDKMSSYSFEEFVEISEFDGNVGDTILPIVSAYTNSNQVTQQGMTKMMNYYLRKAGIQSIAVYGKYIATDFSNFGGNAKNGELNQVIQENGNQYTVTIDASNLYVWNMIQLNQNWYHFDVYYRNKFKHYLQDFRRNNGEANYQIQNFYMGLGLSDYSASLGRLFYVNEDILGIQPMARNNRFNLMFRKQNPFILDTPSNQLRPVVIEEIINKAMKDRPRVFSVTFESPENFQQVFEEMSIIINEVEQIENIKVKSYQVLKLEGADTLVIYNLIYE